MTNSYTPTAAEFERARINSPELKVSGDGVFATLQGEGVTAGSPAIFLRLQNCNLHCGKAGNGWRCDTWYTWDTDTPEYWQETRLAEAGSLADEIKDAWDQKFDNTATPKLVITGGEPLLQQSKIIELLTLLPDWSIEIETNGTILPDPRLQVCQINCSPKLASSGNSRESRRRIDALKSIAAFPNHWFKFVIAEEKDIEEVREIMDLINGGDFSRVLLMSEGSDPNELQRTDERLAVVANNLGCLMTKRNHIFWFGDKRGT